MRSQNEALDRAPPDRIIDFDIYDDARLQGDPHEAIFRLTTQLPPVFWTPANGGHWIVTNYALIDEVVKDHERFSARANHVPHTDDGIVMIPLNLDPPAHNHYRKILMRHFGPAAIKKLEPRIVQWAGTLVEAVVDQGRCEFMDEVGSLFPVSVFMEIMGLPLERLREYRGLVVDYFGATTRDRWLELQCEITQQMREVLEARLAEPRDDMLSALIADRTEDRKLSMDELESLANQLFQAGMDTVANFAGFFFRLLGQRPDLQRQFRDQPETSSGMIEEGFRLLGVVNNGRMASRDQAFGGVTMRAGDVIVNMLPFAGLDGRLNPDAGSFRPDRVGREHMIFSKGAHLCIGHTLARAEMRILLKEWFIRIPEFWIAEDYDPIFRLGHVLGLSHLPLEWRVG